MTDYYVDDGGDDSDGLTWAKAYNDLDNALDNVAAGDTIFMGHNTVKTYAGDVTYTSPGTAILPVNIVSVTQGSTTPEAYEAGAIEDADAAIYDLNFAGHAVVYGVTFKSGDDVFISANNSSWDFHNCTIELNGGAGPDQFGIAGAGKVLRMFDTNVKFTHADQGFALGQACHFIWHGGTLQTTDIGELFKTTDANGYVDIRGVDLSIISGGAFFDGAGAASDELPISTISGCKLNATKPALFSDTNVVAGAIVKVTHCSSDGTPYFIEAGTNSNGEIEHDDSVYRSGQDPSSNDFSAKMTSNANTSYYNPLKFKLASVWCSANPTITVHCTHDVNGDATDLQDDEFWTEIEFPTTSINAFRQWDRSARRAPNETGSDHTTEGAAGWTSSQNVDNSVAVTLSGSAGVYTVWAVLGRASETVYVCPQTDVT